MAIIESGNTASVVNIIQNGALAAQFETSNINSLADLKNQVKAANSDVSFNGMSFTDNLGNIMNDNSSFDMKDEMNITMIKSKTKAGGYKQDKATVKGMVNDPVDGAKVKDAIKAKYGKNYTQLKANQMADVASNGILKPKKVAKKKLSKKKVVKEVISEPTKEVLGKALKNLPSAIECAEISAGQLVNSIRLINPDERLLVIVESLQDMFKQNKCDFKTFSGIKALK